MPDAPDLRTAVNAYIAALDEFRKQEKTVNALPAGEGLGEEHLMAAFDLDDAEADLRAAVATTEMRNEP